MIAKMGIAAGKIWEALDANGEMSLAQLRKTVEKNDFILSSSIGWLAREAKLNISKKGNSIRISLK